MIVMCPLVHNYPVITLDNWYLAHCYPTRSKDYKTVDREASIAWVHSHLLFSYFRLIFV